MKAPTLDDSVRMLRSGLNLDALVCDEVMGWKATEDWEDVEQAEETGETVFYIGEFIDGTTGEVYYGSLEHGEFSPSRRIEDAWLVQERVSALVVDQDRHDFGHLTLVRRGFNHGWTASYDTIIDDDEWFEHAERYPRTATGETAPLAICRASLLACAILPQDASAKAP